MSYSEQHLRETSEIVSQLDPALCEKAVELLAAVRARGGRLFILGVGGSAANASHAVNDFRKLAGLEAYAPTDNVSELTARTNDDGWSSVFAEWLKGSRLNDKDAILVLSVGGGSLERLPPPTDNTRIASFSLSRLPLSQSAKTEDHPSSLVRAVSSETLSVGSVGLQSCKFAEIVHGMGSIRRAASHAENEKPAAASADCCE